MSDQDSDSNSIIPNFLNMKYEYLFRVIGREGKLPLGIKCVILVLIMLIPCLIVTFIVPWFTGGFLFASSSLQTYFTDGWRHFVGSILAGVFVWFLVRFLRRLEKNMQLVNEIISPIKKQLGQKGYEEWKQWRKKIEDYKEWAHTSYSWYYLGAFGGSICGFIIGHFLVTPEHTWVLNDPFKAVYLRMWYIFFGFLVGVCAHYIFSTYALIRKYCKSVISAEEILPLDPDRTGGLRELGRLSLDLDFLVAVPSVAFPMLLLRYKLFALLGLSSGTVSIQEIQLSIFLSIIYAFVIVFIFFGSISPAHDSMIEAKKDYILKIHNEYRDIHNELLRKLSTSQSINLNEYKKLSSLHDLYDRVENMAVWPLDFRTTLRFAITSTLPLLSLGLTIQLGF